MDKNDPRPLPKPSAVSARRRQEQARTRAAELGEQSAQLRLRFQEALSNHAQSYTLGHVLLRHGTEGVALVYEGRVVGANRRFYDYGSRAECFDYAEGGDPAGGRPLLDLLLEAAENLQSIPSPPEDGDEQESRTPPRRLQLADSHGGRLEAILHRISRPRPGIGIILRDTSEALALRVEREEGSRRDNFLAMLAHELRNPVAAILSAAELLQCAKNPRSQQDAIEIIKRQATHQARLVDDLLDTARVRQGKIVLQRAVCDVREVLREAAQSTQWLRAHGVSFTLELPGQPVYAEVDRTRLLQCVTNLLTNAAKFTDAGGQNTLRLEARDLAWISVCDTGIGLTPDMLTRVFDVFVQGDSSLARGRGGLGLGLALTRRLMQMHGGGVRAASEGPGRGSQFTIWLPRLTHWTAPTAPDLEHPPSQPAVPHPPAPPPAEQRVLLIEDNHDIRRTLALLLESEGYQVLAARDGQEGLDMALRERPELIISDLGLPVIDGLTLGPCLRAKLPKTTLIALSGYANDETRQRAHAAGFTGYVVKPVRFDELLDAIGAAQLPN